MSDTAVTFSATGTNQIYLVQTSGTYRIEAAGAEGGAGAGPGVKGDRVSGMFYLKRGNLLKIVAGSQGLPSAPPHDVGGGGGGASLVWTGSTELPQPIKLMLFASGGKGGAAAKAQDAGGIAESNGSKDDSDPTADAGEFNILGGGMDPLTAETLALEWTRGTGSVSTATASGQGRDKRGNYNAGAFRTSAPESQAGDGYVSITPVSVPASSGATGNRPTGAAAPTEIDAQKLAPAGGSDGGTTSIPPTVHRDQGNDIPSPTILPQVTSRPGSWTRHLRPQRRPGSE
ncbi:MAG TPA: hypothetical protein VMC06_13285 [Opitutaceae bacterium]|nr:hypothetical protein [Opitutaceae bacterium]